MKPFNKGAENLLGVEFPVLDKGFVTLLDYMGSDAEIDKAAQQSYLKGGEARTDSQVKRLLRFLMRKRHTSPFEMAELKFQVRVPLAIWRQWIRHRTASLNEASGRYIVLKEQLYFPEVSRFRTQSEDSKQCSSDQVLSDASEVRERFVESTQKSYEDYEFLVSRGLAKEVARNVLPLNIYIDATWKMDLHNLFHFLELRLGEGVQEEFVDYAKVIENIVSQCFPISHQAFVDFRRDSRNLSRMEISALKSLLKKGNLSEEEISKTLQEEGCAKREISEFLSIFI